MVLFSCVYMGPSNWNLALVHKALSENVEYVLNYPFNNFIIVSGFIITTREVFIVFWGILKIPRIKTKAKIFYNPNRHRPKKKPLKISILDMTFQ